MRQAPANGPCENAALGMLATSGEPEAVERVAHHYHNAQNMTDAIAALGVLTHLQDEIRAKAFDDFFQRWEHDHLVIDKWFAAAGNLQPSRDARQYQGFDPSPPVLLQDAEQGSRPDRCLRRDESNRI